MKDYTKAPEYLVEFKDEYGKEIDIISEIADITMRLRKINETVGREQVLVADIDDVTLSGIVFVLVAVFRPNENSLNSILIRNFAREEKWARSRSRARASTRGGSFVKHSMGLIRTQHNVVSSTQNLLNQFVPI